jgi:UDP-N-acetylmuramoylalanine--D-glutamate ligase
MEAYMQAKAQIILHQKSSDVAILGHDDAGSRSLIQAVQGQCAVFSGREMVADGAFMAGQRLLVSGLASHDGDPHVICNRDDIALRGDHNVLNVLAACAITGANRVSPEVMEAAIRDFRPVPHRLELVRVLDGVTYINDSIATAPERVVAALRSFTEPLILLAGGKDKKLPWEDMLRLALAKCRHIIAFGEAGDLVVEVIGKITPSKDIVSHVTSLEEAVAEARNQAQPGDIVLLSPGGTSYDAYLDFAERGEHFRQLVMRL